MPLPEMLVQSLKNMSYDKAEIKLINQGLEDSHVEELVNLLTEYPNPKVISLDLSSNNLRSASGKLLGFLTQIKHLNLAHNKLGDEGAISLSSNRSLKTLNASYNGLTNRSANHLLSISNLSVNLEGNPQITLPSVAMRLDVAAALSNLSRTKDTGIAEYADEISRVRPEIK